MSADVASVDPYQEDSASPLTVSKPAAFASGQILIFVISQDGGLLSALTVPSGWTAVTGGTVDISSQRDKAFYHVFNGSEPSTWDFPYDAGSSVAGLLFRITGADTTPTLVCATGNINANLSSMDSPTVTPSGSTDLLICTYSNFGGGTALGYTAPSGMTNLGSSQVTGNHQCIAGAKQLLATGSATGAKTWTSLSPTGGPAGTFSIAIKSAAAGGSGVWLPNVSARRRTPTAPRPPRARMSTPVRAQVNPPFPVNGVKQPRPLRGLNARRGRTPTPVPAQVVVTPPAYPPAGLRARVKGLRLSRGRAFVPPPEQSPPPPVVGKQARGLRGLLGRRSRTTSPVPTQVALPPTYPPVGLRARVRGLRPARPRQAVPVPAQATVPAPAWVSVGLRERIRGLRLGRARLSAPVPAQSTPPAPPWVAQTLRARVKAAFARLRRPTAIPPEQVGPLPAQAHRGGKPATRRRSTAAPPPPQLSLPTAASRRTAKPAAKRGRRGAQVVPPQILLPPPPYPPQSVHKQRFGRRRGTHGAEGWMVGATETCTVTRPNIGLVTRPGGGSVTRPDIGVVDRPGCD
jgi:hypothetical protein